MILKIVTLVLILGNFKASSDSLMVKVSENNLNRVVNTLIHNKFPFTYGEEIKFNTKKVINISGKIWDLKINKDPKINIKYNSSNSITVNLNEVDGSFNYDIKMLFRSKNKTSFKIKNLSIDIEFAKNNFDLNLKIIRVDAGDIKLKVSNGFINFILKIINVNNFLIKKLIRELLKTDISFPVKNIIVPFEQDFTNYEISLGNYLEIIQNKFLILSLKVNIFNTLFKKYYTYNSDKEFNYKQIVENNYDSVYVANKILSQFLNGFLMRFYKVISGEGNEISDKISLFFPNIKEETNNSILNIGYGIKPILEDSNKDSTTFDYKQFLFLNKNAIMLNNINIEILGDKGRMKNYVYCTINIKNYLNINISTDNQYIYYGDYSFSDSPEITNEECELEFVEEKFKLFFKEYLTNQNGKIDYYSLINKFGIDLKLKGFNMQDDNLLVSIN